jgi:hypothetical protein
MKYLVRLVILTAVVATVFTFSAVRPAGAIACGPLLFDQVLSAPQSGTINVIAGHVYYLYYDGVLFQIYTAPTTGPVPYNFPAAHVQLVDITVGCAPAAFFNPGDGRVDPRPGDRVAVYCNTSATPPTLDVWGVTNDSIGHRLFTFAYADLLSAGSKGILKKVEPLGSVFASTDGNGNFLVKWYGGPAGAIGTKDFAKSFACGFAK